MRVLVLMSLVSILLATPALAGDCNTGGTHAPSPYHTAACDVNNYGRVCQYRWDSGTSQYVWDCYADRDQGSGCGVMTAVVDYDGSSPTLFSAWGTTSQGTNFCCTESRTVNEVRLNGTNVHPACGDVLKLNYNSGSKNLGTNSTASPPTLVTGVVYGNDGDDEIEGSYDTDYSAYRDRLFGGDHDDTIDGHDGNDYIEGGDGDDTIDGGDGGDTIEGNEMDDTIYGGDHNDEINGDAGADELWGEDGLDLVCGGADDDDLFGGLMDDILVGGGQTLDYKHGGGVGGGAYGNECDPIGTNIACTYTYIISSYTCP